MSLIIIIHSSCRLIGGVIARWNSTIVSNTCVLIPVVRAGAVVGSCLPYRDHPCLLRVTPTNDRISPHPHPHPHLLLLLLHSLEGIGLGV